MDSFLLPLIYILVLAILIALPIVILIFIYQWVKKTRHRKIAIFISLLIIGAFTYFIYSSFHPNDNFYITDFERNTLIKLPKSTKIIDKDATFPDQHGHYTSRAIFELNEQDYLNVFRKLKNDSLFEVDTNKIKFFMDTEKFFKENDIEFNKIDFMMIGGGEVQLKTGFLKDHKTIIFERHT